jgi:ADP-ribosyl-[dinitrogen reductase] hydrolase
MARTSLSDPLRINEISLAGGARLGLTLCPGKRQPQAQTGPWDRDLDADLSAIRDWGASAVCTLMEEHELHHLEVPTLGDGGEARAMDWHFLPISDGKVPNARTMSS